MYMQCFLHEEATIKCEINLQKNNFFRNTMMVMKSCHWLLIGIILTLRTICQATEESKFSAETKLSNFPNSDAFLGVVLAVEQDSHKRESNRTDSNLSLVRKRRFVRFPSGPGYAFEGQHPRSIGLANMRFGPQAQFPSWRQQKSFWRPPVSGPPVPEFSRPVMGHRTPRLIFRDNDFPVTTGNGVSSNFFQSNQLPELEEEIRGTYFFYFLYALIVLYIFTL